MMAQAAPLLLLLLWLFMGLQGQEIQEMYKEGQTLTVTCHYSPQIGENRWKSLCKFRENTGLCYSLITRKPDFTEQYRDPRASLEDDTYFGTITITMANLTVEDSGNYRCGIYDSVHNTIDVISTIRLEVSP
ncbi:trem-like transcript 4 protein, partial [Petaurus breviceps papuanus]|uniref:trem-like transcript 4 protein n=1 Tax=Petaurus breviceps papuanus TaxID=3040969 RepID=UPI0036DE4C5E